MDGSFLRQELSDEGETGLLWPSWTPWCNSSVLSVNRKYYIVKPLDAALHRGDYDDSKSKVGSLQTADVLTKQPYLQSSLRTEYSSTL